MIENTKYPLISVIVPTFQRSSLLPRAIDSILAQTWENIEIVVVDDNLPDSEEQKEDTNYLDGIQGLLKTKDGQQLNLDNIGTTPLAEKVKTKACDLVLKQGLNFIS